MQFRFFTLFLLCWSLMAHANPGDTTRVNIHTLDSLTYYGTYTRIGQLPTNNVTYRKIYLLYTIGKYQCPSGEQYCGQWDYSLYFDLKPLNPAVSSETFEVARGITPYALTGSVFPWTWKHTYVVDVTHLAPILKDSAELRAVYSGYSGGFTLASQFMFIEGTPAREPVQVITTNKGYFAYGKVSDPIESHLTPDTLTVTAPATQADMWVNITGHGADNTGCSEFCKKYYRVKLNGAQIVQKDLWKECGFGDIQAQTGTWIYDRANWCPGEKVLANRHPLTNISAGTPFVVDLDMQTYTAPNDGAGFSVNSYIVTYKDHSFAIDAEVEDIVSPSQTNDYKKFNPSCGKPVIRVKNNGTTPLTTLTIQYGMVGASAPASFSWSGSISPLETKEIALPVLPASHLLADGSRFYALLSQPNGAQDQYAANDTAFTNYTVVPTLPAAFIVRLNTNNTAATFPGGYNETQWKLYANDGTLIQQRINNANSTTYNDTLSLMPGCYYFDVEDRGEKDGLSWWVYPNYNVNPGTGSFSLRRLMQTSPVIPNTTTKLNAKYFAGDFGARFLYYFKVDASIGTSESGAEGLDFEIFPNPAQDVVYFNIPEQQTGTVRIELLDTQGRVVATQESENLQDRLEMTTATIPNGMYFVRVTKEDGTKYQLKRLVIIRG